VIDSRLRAVAVPGRRADILRLAHVMLLARAAAVSSWQHGARAGPIPEPVASGRHLACSVEERGEDGVDLVGGQQGGTVAKAG
jgi:hypothetical protein